MTDGVIRRDVPSPTLPEIPSSRGLLRPPSDEDAVNIDQTALYQGKGKRKYDRFHSLTHLSLPDAAAHSSPWRRAKLLIVELVHCRFLSSIPTKSRGLCYTFLRSLVPFNLAYLWFHSSLNTLTPFFPPFLFFLCPLSKPTAPA